MTGIAIAGSIFIVGLELVVALLYGPFWMLAVAGGFMGIGLLIASSAISETSREGRRQKVDKRLRGSFREWQATRMP